MVNTGTPVAIAEILLEHFNLILRCCTLYIFKTVIIPLNVIKHTHTFKLVKPYCTAKYIQIKWKTTLFNKTHHNSSVKKNLKTVTQKYYRTLIQKFYKKYYEEDLSINREYYIPFFHITASISPRLQYWPEGRRPEG